MTNKLKYRLGQRVRYVASMHRFEGSREAKWERISLPTPREGVIVGKRTVSDGFTQWFEDHCEYTPLKYHSFWLVAVNLTSYRYVAEEDLEAID